MIIRLVTLRQVSSYGIDEDSTEVVPHEIFHVPLEEKIRRNRQEQHSDRKGHEEQNPNLILNQTESLDNLNKILADYRLIIGPK
jgi:hypothetical protein